MRPLSWPILLSLGFAGACIFISADEHAGRFDQDGDGIPWPDDCDDTNPAVAEDCGPVSNLDTVDDDGDGFSEADGDCDDTNASLSPADADLDGYSTCDGDCDDTNGNLSPADADLDGYSTCDGDCSAADPGFYPIDTDEDGEEDYCGWLDLAVGTASYCALKTDGSAACWGDNESGELEVPEGRYKELSMGHVHGCGITESSNLVCWGEDQGPDAPGANQEVVSVSAGCLHSCALTGESDIVCWGEDSQQGEVPDDAPAASAWLSDVAALSSGFYYACVVAKQSPSQVTGWLFCWGEEVPGGINWELPLQGYKSVSAGHTLVCAVDEEDTVECWADGALPVPPPEDPFVSISVFSAGERKSGDFLMKLYARPVT